MGGDVMMVDQIVRAIENLHWDEVSQLRSLLKERLSEEVFDKLFDLVEPEDDSEGDEPKRKGRGVASKTAKNISEALSLHGQGWSYAKIGKQFGRSRSWARELLKRYDKLPKRTPKRKR